MLADISIQDIKNYLNTLSEDQEVGIPQHKSQCLIARTIRWMHPSTFPGLSIHISMGTHNYGNQIGASTVDLPEDVHKVAEEFDALWKAWIDEREYGEPITKAVLRERMPELFDEKA